MRRSLRPKTHGVASTLGIFDTCTSTLYTANEIQFEIVMFPDHRFLCDLLTRLGETPTACPGVFSPHSVSELTPALCFLQVTLIWSRQIPKQSKFTPQLDDVVECPNFACTHYCSSLFFQCCRLRGLIDRPPIGGKEFLPLSGQALLGFRLLPGAVSFPHAGTTIVSFPSHIRILGIRLCVWVHRCRLELWRSLC